MSIDTKLRNWREDRASLINVGDFNGDGFDDFTAIFYAPDGQVYSYAPDGYSTKLILDGAQIPASSLYFGNENTYYDQRVLSSLADAGTGYKTVLPAGDVNGDGFDDLLVLGERGQDASDGNSNPYDYYGYYGYYTYSGEEAPSGSATQDGRPAYIIFGATEFAGEAVFVPAGSDSGKTLGSGVEAVAVGSLINPNGLEDIVLGRPDGAGAVELIFGAYALGAFDEAFGDVTINGVQAGGAFGTQVGVLGAYEDGLFGARSNLLISAPGVDVAGRTDAGEVYIISAAALPRIDDNDNMSLEISDVPNGFLAVVQGAISGARLGTLLEVLGDVDGDGAVDFAISATDPLNGKKQEIYVLYGPTSGEQLGTLVNGRNTIDLLNLSDDVGVRFSDIDALSGDDFRITALGDVSGDGLADFAISIPENDATGRLGEVVLILGDRSGLQGGDIDLLDYGANAFRFVGSQGDQLGRVVEPLGDYDQDGIDDFFIGSADGGHIIQGGFTRFWTLDSLGGSDGQIEINLVATSDLQSVLRFELEDEVVNFNSNGGFIGNARGSLFRDNLVFSDSVSVVDILPSANGYVTTVFDSAENTLETDATKLGSAAVLALNEGEILEDFATYTVTNGLDTGTSTIIFRAVGADDAPIAQDDFASIAATESILIDVLANDFDPEGSALILVSVSGALSGTTSIEGNQIRYTSGADGALTDSFTYSVRDQSGLIGEASVQVDTAGSFATHTITLSGNFWGFYFGVAQVGDVNGDGRDDLFLGSETIGSGSGFFDFDLSGGVALVESPEFGNWTLEQDFSDLNEILRGEPFGGRGFTVASLGDFNGDGFEDVAFGSAISFFFDDSERFGRDWGTVGDGYSGILFGGPQGLTPDSLFSPGEGGVGIYAPIETSFTDNFETEVAAVGDLDGDGFDDALVMLRSAITQPSISSPNSLSQQFTNTEAHVVWGRAGGGSEATLGGGPDTAKINSSFLAGGVNISGAGDVNGDGTQDLLITGDSAFGSSGSQSVSYVVYGGARDAFSGINLDTLDASAGFKIVADRSNSSLSGFGSDGVSLGDFNGDGLDDIAIGASFARGVNDASSVGSVAVIFGGFDGAVLDAASLDGSNGFLISGEVANQRLADSFTGAGDFNFDGLNDLVIAARDEVSIIYGSAGTRSAVLNYEALTASEALKITTEHDYSFFTGRPLSGGTDLNGDGRDDITFGDGRLPDGSLALEVVFGGRTEILDVLDGSIDGRIDLDLLKREVPVLTPIIPNDGGGNGGDGGGDGLPGPQTISLVSNGIVTEGDMGTEQSALFTFSRTGDTQGSVTISYTLAGQGDAAIDEDDVLSGLLGDRQIVIGEGQTSETVSVPVRGDLLIEENETLGLTITDVSASSGGEISVSVETAEVEILNDDVAAVLRTIGDSIVEGDSGTRSLILAIERSGGVDDGVSAVWRVDSSGDFPVGSQDLLTDLPLIGTARFEPGETRFEVQIQINGDFDIEQDETVELTITSASSDAGNPVIIAEDRATGIVETDDFPPELRIEGGRVAEGDDGIQSVGFNVFRTGGEGQSIDVDYRISSSSADANDATPVNFSGSLTLGPDDFGATIPVDVFGDLDPETDETLVVEILSARTRDGVPADIVGNGATLVIENDDEPAVFSVRTLEDVIVEGNSGETFAEFIVTRAGELDNTVTIGWSATEELEASRIVDTWVREEVVDLRFGWRVLDTNFRLERGVNSVTDGEILSRATSIPLDGSDVFQTLTPTFLFDEIALTSLSGDLPNLTLPLTKFDLIEGGTQSFRDGPVTYDFVWPDIDLEVELDGPTLGDVSLSYPTQTQFQTPGYVIAGEEVRLSTAALQAINPKIIGESLNFGSLDVDLAYDAGEVGVKNLVLSSFFGNTLARVDDLAFDVNSNDRVDLFTIRPGLSAGVSDPTGILSLSAALPSGNKSSGGAVSSDALPTLEAISSEALASFKVDLLNLGSLIPGLQWARLLSGGTDPNNPIDLGPFELSAEYSLFDLDIDWSLSLQQSFTFLPDIPTVSVTVGSIERDISNQNSVTFDTSRNASSLDGTVSFGFGGALLSTLSLVPVFNVAAKIGQAALKLTNKATNLSLTGEIGPLASAGISVPLDDPLISQTFSFDVSPDTFAPVSFDFSVPVLPAPAPDDALLFGAITFAPGETEKVIRVPIRGDTNAEVDGDLIVRLDSANAITGAAELRVDEARVRVLDSDVDSRVEFDVLFRPTFRGDPHLVTTDGLAYSFMAVGEFTAIESISGAPFTLQTRLSPQPGSDLLSVISAVATNIDGHHVSFDVASSVPLLVDGEPVTIDLETGYVEVGAGRITFDGEIFTLVMPSEERIFVTLRDGFIDLELATDPARGPGEFRGLLGNLDGDRSNDLALPDGTVLPDSPSFGTLYGAFAEGWRITDTQSLFDYADGLSTEDFTDRSFPRADISLEDLPDEVLEAAAAVVDSFGVPAGAGRDAAILDFALTGNPDFIASAEATDPRAVGKTEILDAPDLVDAIGITTTSPILTEGGAGDVSEAVFHIYRVSDLAEQLTVSIARSGSISASETIGEIPDTVTFTAGEDSIEVRVAVQGDAEVEDDGTISLSISVADETPHTMLSRQATVVIQDDDIPVLPIVSVSTAEATVTEGDSVDTEVTFTLTRSGDAALPLNAAWIVVASSAFAPVQAMDFNADELPRGIATFAAGAQTTQVTVKLAGDFIAEADEGFALRLLSEDGYEIGQRDATVLILDDDINQAPIAEDTRTVEASEDIRQIIDLNDFVTDPEDEQLQFILPTETFSGGTLNDLGGGLLEFTPVLNFTGQDELSVTVTDSGGLTLNDVKININVTAFNSDPVATDDGQGGSVGFDTQSNARLLLPDLLSNDADGDPGDQISLSRIMTTGTLGEITQLENGDIIYDPNGAFDKLAPGTVTLDQFSYEITDTSGAKDTAIVSIRISGPATNAPVATSDMIFTDEDTPLLLDALLLTNDTDVDGDDLTINGITSGPSNGAIEQAQDGSWTYTPNANFEGEDSFGYEVSDGNGGFDVTPVFVSVRGKNDAPVAQDDMASTDANTSIDVAVLANDIDIDSTDLTVSVALDALAAERGALNVNNDGSINFAPGSAFAELAVGDSEAVTFDYTLSDGELEDTASVSILVDGTFVEEPGLLALNGTSDRDRLRGTEADELINGGSGSDTYFGQGGADTFVFDMDGIRDREAIRDFETGVDSILLNDAYSVRFTSRYAVITTEEDGDSILVYGDAQTVGDLAILTTADQFVF